MKQIEKKENDNFDTLRYSNMAMEKRPFMSDFPIKTSIHLGFSIVMFDYQRVDNTHKARNSGVS